MEWEGEILPIFFMQTRLFLPLLFLLLPTSLYGQDLGQISSKISSSLVAIQVEWTSQEEMEFLKQGKLTEGVGTGIFIDSEGHFISDLSILPDLKHKIKIIFPSGKTGYAQILGTDKINQLALFKVEEKTSFLEMGDSRKLQTGQFLIAAGNIYGSLARNLKNPISLGTLSDQYALLEGNSYRGSVLEITAALHEGSFGGALVDLEGRLVGMLISTYSPQRWLGLAIPIHQIQMSLALLKKGKIPLPGRLGVAMVQSNRGNMGPVVMEEIMPGSPGEKGGLKGGDVLLQIESNPVVSLNQVDGLLKNLPAGTSLEMKVLRKEKKNIFTVELGEADPDSMERIPKPEITLPSKTEPDKKETKNPGTAKASPKAQKGVLGILPSEWSDGIFVRAILKGSSAQKEGILPGDQLLKGEGKKLSSLEDLSFLKEKKEGEVITFEIQRGEWKMEKKITLTAPDSLKKEILSYPSSWEEWGIVWKSNSLQIEEIRKNSLAEWIGLKKGDEIVLWKGSSPSIENPSSLWGEARAGETITFQIQRKGWKKEFSFRKH